MRGRGFNDDANIFQAFSHRDVIRHARPANNIRRRKGQKQNQGHGPRDEQSNQSHHGIRGTKPSQGRKAKFVSGNPVGNIAKDAIKPYKRKPSKVRGHTSRPRMRQLQQDPTPCPMTLEAHFVYLPLTHVRRNSRVRGLRALMENSLFWVSCATTSSGCPDAMNLLPILPNSHRNPSKVRRSRCKQKCDCLPIRTRNSSSRRYAALNNRRMQFFRERRKRLFPPCNARLRRKRQPVP